MARTPIDPKYYELANKNKIKKETFQSRVYARGWTPEKAATTPLKTAGSGYNEYLKNRAEEIDYARRKEVPLDELRSATRGLKIEHWTPEQVAAHLEVIGPDKHFETAQKKSSHLDITAPQERRNNGGQYQKKGGGW